MELSHIGIVQQYALEYFSKGIAIFHTLAIGDGMIEKSWNIATNGPIHRKFHWILAIVE